MNEMVKTDKVLSRKEGGVGYVVFNNPERHNAMSLDMWAATGRIMDEFARDDALRVVVLTGAGTKAFVSGADISRFGAERSNEEAVAHYNATVEKASLALYTYAKPTIAMIRGYCIGGGLAIALCCDLRIATEQSTFAVPAAKLGLGYGHLGGKPLLDVVGPSFTKEIFYTARQFDAQAAKQMGVTKRYAAAAGVDDVSLRIEHGLLVCLLGPSGCDKTTTLRLIAGFVEPTAGETAVGDKVVSSAARTLPPEQRNMLMIFQSYALW